VPYASVDDLTVYYAEQGRADGPPLVLLHGFTGTGNAWAAQLSAFGASYRLIIPDLRGHGRTNNPGGLAAMNHRQFARDTIALCRALGIEHAAFCGHSTGAMQLLTLALEAPGLAQALVLAGGTYFYGEELRDWWRGQVPETLVSDIAAMQARHTAFGPDHWRMVAEAFIAVGTHAHTEDFPEPAALHAIATPTLIIHGDRDWFFSVEVPAELYRMLPDARLCILPETGHGLPWERPAWFNTIVLDFLAPSLGAEVPSIGAQDPGDSSQAGSGNASG